MFYKCQIYKTFCSMAQNLVNDVFKISSYWDD